MALQALMAQHEHSWSRLGALHVSLGLDEREHSESFSTSRNHIKYVVRIKANKITTENRPAVIPVIVHDYGGT